MPQTHTIPGVPLALQIDAHWLEDHPSAPQAAQPKPALILPLLLLADLLFWQQTPGLSLALFALAIFAATKPRRHMASFATLILSTLPVIDYVQPLSFAILTIGLPTAIALNRGTSPISGLLTLLRHIPTALPRHTIQNPPKVAPRTWAFPATGTVILVILLAQANPVLASWLTLPNPINLAMRTLFWAALALTLWPLLTPQTPAKALTLPTCTVLNPSSVTLALMLFNGILGLHNGLDAIYLYGQTSPPGMTLATYAHRGAYPLLATALLAGAFALAARPWVAERPALKPLFLLWLAQNIWLTISALYRLDLYVDAFGLTYLRAHAAIWMALVATGLALTLAQTALHKPNRWLLMRCATLGVTTLYLCAFINFASLIARYNLTHNHADPSYLCTLPPTAAADVPCLTPPHIQGWRDWGFRNWRVLHTLRAQEKADEDPRRG